MARAKKTPQIETKKDTQLFIVIEPYYDKVLGLEMKMDDEIYLETERAKELLALKLVKLCERA